MNSTPPLSLVTSLVPSSPANIELISLQIFGGFKYQNKPIRFNIPYIIN